MMKKESKITQTDAYLFSPGKSTHVHSVLLVNDWQSTATFEKECVHTGSET
jgi:hypothetical protein